MSSKPEKKVKMLSKKEKYKPKKIELHLKNEKVISHKEKQIAKLELKAANLRKKISKLNQASEEVAKKTKKKSVKNPKEKIIDDKKNNLQNLILDEKQHNVGYMDVQGAEKNNKLLLAYTYFLNGDKSKNHITVGFSTISLQVVVLLTVNDNILELTPAEWFSIFTQTDNISKHVNGDFMKYADFSLSERRSLCFIPEQPGITLISDNNTQTTIGKQDWISILTLTDLLNTILVFYNKIYPDILQYYLKYVQLCFENNVLSLNHTQYFQTEKKVEFNTSRLFNELGIFFTQKYGRVEIN